MGRGIHNGMDYNDSFFSQGIKAFQGAPIAGYILKTYGGTEAGRAAFRPAMYYAGSMSLGSAFFALGLRSLMTKKLFAFA